MKSICVNSISPDDVVMRIKDEQQFLHISMKNILNSPKKPHQLRDNLKSEVNFDIKIRKENATNEYNNFDKYVKMFNKIYIERGEFISKHFIQEMESVYFEAETVLSWFNEISMSGVELNVENYKKLKIHQMAIEYVVNVLIKLDNRAQEKENMELNKLKFERDREEELKRIEYRSEINKDYCNNIRKVVNHICSQITSDNPGHTRDRLRDLVLLFQGEDIPLVGTNKHINVNSHPRAKEICWEFLQKAVITQAESQFCENIDTVRVFASLLSAVLGQFPNEMNAMLTALETRFSQLLLFNAQSSSIDDDQYDEEKHLDSLKGLGHLVAAISVAHPPPGFVSHPDLNPGFLWSLLARMNNRTSASLFTAQAYLALLKIGSNSLFQYYGNQFEKLLIAIQEKFHVPKCLTERNLKLFISEGLEKKSFPDLSCLPDKYWMK